VDRAGHVVFDEQPIMVPFYVYYSIFGSSASATWPAAAGDMQARASCWAARRGARRLNGEGLQHEGRPQPHPGGHHSNCISYDPTSPRGGRDPAPGLKRMVEKQDTSTLLTLLNETMQCRA